MSSVSRSVVATEEGEPVYEYILSNGRVSITALSYGATVTSIKAPDRNGTAEEITLCYSDLSDLKTKSRYFGCIAGRFANRIKLGKFELDGESHQLAINNGVNGLHGGVRGFDKRIWTSRVIMDTKGTSLEFSYLSADGEEGYPGAVHATVTYTLSESDELHINYHATTTKATPINLTSHTYFNLSGQCRRSILEHQLQLSCGRYLPVDETQIPTGETRDCAGSYFDLASGADSLAAHVPFIDGCGQPGIDHCYVVDGAVSEVAPGGALVADGALRQVATLTDPISGRQLSLRATQPGVQVYTANYLSQDPASFPFTQHNAVCLETQHFPDSINQPHFPNVVLRPGEVYQQAAIFSFKVV